MDSAQVFFILGADLPFKGDSKGLAGVQILVPFVLLALMQPGLHCSFLHSWGRFLFI